MGYGGNAYRFTLAPGKYAFLLALPEGGPPGQMSPGTMAILEVSPYPAPRRRPISRRRLPIRTSSHSPAIGSGTNAGSVTRVPLIVTPPAGDQPPRLALRGDQPASASTTAVPAASPAGSNVNPPADSYSERRTAGSSIAPPENFASESATARAAASSRASGP